MHKFLLWHAPTQVVAALVVAVVLTEFGIKLDAGWDLILVAVGYLMLVAVLAGLTRFLTR